MQLLNQTIVVNSSCDDSLKKDSKKPKKVTYPPSCKCKSLTKDWRAEVGRDRQIGTLKAIKLCSRAQTYSVKDTCTEHLLNLAEKLGFRTDVDQEIIIYHLDFIDGPRNIETLREADYNNWFKDSKPITPSPSIIGSSASDSSEHLTLMNSLSEQNILRHEDVFVPPSRSYKYPSTPYLIRPRVMPSFVGVANRLDLEE